MLVVASLVPLGGRVDGWIGRGDMKAAVVAVEGPPEVRVNTAREVATVAAADATAPNRCRRRRRAEVVLRLIGYRGGGRPVIPPRPKNALLVVRSFSSTVFHLAFVGSSSAS